jgi:hypothetical protein
MGKQSCRPYERLEWAEHVMRMEEHCTPKKALQQTIHSKRRIGKPRKSWEDGVTEDAVTLLVAWYWKTTAKDRVSWRQCIEEAKARYGL